MTELVDVAASAEVGERQKLVVTVGSARLVLIRVEGRVYAVDDRCPHRDGELGQGELDGFHLFCPLHAWVFDVRDGRGFFPKGAEIACYAVEESNGRIRVAAKGVKPSQTGRWP